MMTKICQMTSGNPTVKINIALYTHECTQSKKGVRKKKISDLYNRNVNSGAFSKSDSVAWCNSMKGGLIILRSVGQDEDGAVFPWR